jgi:hypothetical protein
VQGDAGDPPGNLDGLAAAIEAWRQLGERYGQQLEGLPPPAAAGGRAQVVRQLLRLGDRAGARRWVVAWLRQELARLEGPESLPAELLKAVADVAEATSDQGLLEFFWQGLEALLPPPPAAGVLPLLGVPVLNRPDLLERLLASLDVPVTTLAIVDNSGGRDDADARALRALLTRLEGEGWPGVERVQVARAFGNGGVAAAWNQILLGFPEAALALIVNNDVVLAPGALAEALARLDPGRPQFLPLLPAGDAFSAFLITALAWDRVGLFDDSFHPAYCEDLDYRDRLRACPALEWIHLEPVQAAMAALNPQRSATIGSDPALAAANRRSYQLNRLWYLSRRRPDISRSGRWRQRWLCRWP